VIAVLPLLVAVSLVAYDHRDDSHRESASATTLSDATCTGGSNHRVIAGRPLVSPKSTETRRRFHVPPVR
jgi:hypothetical protein